MLIEYPRRNTIRNRILLSKNILTGKITSPKPSIDFRSERHGSISDSGISKGKENKSGTTSPFVPIPRATCSITDGFFDVLEFEDDEDC